MLHNQTDKEKGSVILLVALMLTVLLGCAAFVVDLGMAYVEKGKLQNVADAAALAGAQDLPAAAGTAINTAKDYAELNGVPEADTSATAPYSGNSAKIEVVCTKNIQYTFARVLGFTDTDLSARAVAQNCSWAGDALPFINLDGKGEDSEEGQPLDAWNKVGPGDKERIHNDDLIVGPDSIKVIIDDEHIKYKKGKDMSQIKGPLMNIVVVGKTVYIFSIKHSEMKNYAKKGSKELKEGDQIPCTDTVLLECEVTDGFDGTGSDTISLKFIKSYAWNTSLETYLSADGDAPGGTTRLVE
jgi:hypothetical protein